MQTEPALQAPDKYLTIINSLDVGFCILQLVFNATQQPVDYHHLECNPVYEQQTGLINAAGKSIRDLTPDVEDFWFETYAKVARSGEPTRFVHHVQALGKWFEIFAFRIGDPQAHQVAVLYTDITRRRQAEEALQRTREGLELRVQLRTAELQKLSNTRQELLQRLVTAQEDERRRIARELHDSLGQLLSALNFRLSVLSEMAAAPAAMVEEICQLRQLVSQSDSELNRLTLELRPPTLDDFGLSEAIRRYAAAWTQTSAVAVEVYDAGLAGGRLAPAIETAVYRIIQEALTNVLKHAQATSVSIIIEQRRTLLQLIIEDNGIGFDPDSLVHPTPDSRRLGLIGMRERAALTGGSLEIESAPGAGATLYVQIPLAGNQAENNA